MHVARDGTAYLTPYTCSGKAGVVVTEDAGLTWHERVVPGSSTGVTTLEGGAATDAAGKLYLVWGSRSGAGGPANVAVSPDKGKTWSRPYDLGQAFGLSNTQFTNAVAGDAGRAAVSFLGAREPGDDQSDSYRGIWRLYVAFTYDGGRTWRTTEATPDSPVQVGAICLGGITCEESRNLLDFNDLAMDPRGHVLAAVTDGCLRSRCTTSSRATLPMIVRQVSGRGLLARYDR